MALQIWSFTVKCSHWLLVSFLCYLIRVRSVRWRSFLSFFNVIFFLAERMRWGLWLHTCRRSLTQHFLPYRPLFLSELQHFIDLLTDQNTEQTSWLLKNIFRHSNLLHERCIICPMHFIHFWEWMSKAGEEWTGR